MPFAIAVLQDVLDDLARRLDATRWPRQALGAQWLYGADLGHVMKLAALWRHNYDWRKWEDGPMPPNHRARIDGFDLHFMVGAVRAAIPCRCCCGMVGRTRSPNSSTLSNHSPIGAARRQRRGWFHRRDTELAGLWLLIAARSSRHARTYRTLSQWPRPCRRPPGAGARNAHRGSCAPLEHYPGSASGRNCS